MKSVLVTLALMCRLGHVGQAQHAPALFAPRPAPLRMWAASVQGLPSAASSPIPVELMTGSRYVSLNLVMSKGLSPASRWGFFHLTTLVLDYDGHEDDDLALQSLLFFEPLDRFRLTAGAFYGSGPGFSPTAGVQFVNSGPEWLVLLAPRVNLEAEPSYSVFSILRHTRRLTARIVVYASLQALNTFDANGHIKSYQWSRIGLDLRGTQVGVAVNLEELGPAPRVQVSAGAFVRRELF
jgi:hypothetical protein